MGGNQSNYRIRIPALLATPGESINSDSRPNIFRGVRLCPRAGRPLYERNISVYYNSPVYAALPIKPVNGLSIDKRWQNHHRKNWQSGAYSRAISG
jgi:hypothetical protein